MHGSLSSNLVEENFHQFSARLAFGNLFPTQRSATDHLRTLVPLRPSQDVIVRDSESNPSLTETDEFRTWVLCSPCVALSPCRTHLSAARPACIAPATLYSRENGLNQDHQRLETFEILTHSCSSFSCKKSPLFNSSSSCSCVWSFVSYSNSRRGMTSP